MSPAAADGSTEAMANCIEAAALYLATQPDAVDRALASHTSDARGCCAGCGSANVRWPCAVAVSARRAEELLDGATAPRRLRG